jgi:hypothetical protein
VLTGFLNAKGEAQGRPVGVAFDRRGALLVADDVGNAIWRVVSDVGRLDTGQRVHITRAPHKGARGVLEALLPGRTLFPNGLRLPGAQVRLEGGESIRVPTANLEIINSS